MLDALDTLLTVFHISVVGACMFLWMSKRTRRWHLWLVALITVSWIVIGPLRGRSLGYCFLTDWQWQVKRQLGVTDLPHTFIRFLFESVGIPEAGWMDVLTGSVLVICVVMSIVLNWRDWRKQRAVTS